MTVLLFGRAQGFAPSSSSNRGFMFSRIRHWLDRSQAPQLGLSEIITQADPAAPTFEKMVWLEQLFLWLKRVPLNDANKSDVRVKYLLAFLEQHVDLRERFLKTLQAVFIETSSAQLLLQTSASRNVSLSGFMGEIFDRATRGIFPRSRDRDLFQVCAGVFGDQEDRAWFDSLSPETLHHLFELISSNPHVVTNLSESLREALVLLSIQIASLGVRGEIQRRLGGGRLMETSFLLLSRDVERFSENLSTFQNSDRRVLAVALEKRLELCQADVDAVYKHIESSGVSVTLVYQLEALSGLLRRVSELVAVGATEEPSERFSLSRSLVSDALRATVENSSVRSHLRDSFRLLSRKVVERNGNSAEHYQARDSQEFWQIFRSGLGGGVIVALMTFCKFEFARITVPPLYQALVTWIIYTGGFLSMQALGFTLATKLPSFTASHLARSLREARTREDVEEFTGEVSGFFRSQTAALAGNLFALVFVVYLVDLACRMIFGQPVADAHYAEHTLETIHPLWSACLPLGALTGLELWVSAIAGGTFENWLAFHGFGEALASHPRLKHIFGPTRARALAEKLIHNASGIAANVTLGFLFAFLPMLGMLLGITLESRHVTIASASALFAIGAHPSSVPVIGASSPMEIALFAAQMLSGLALIGMANLGVSFAMSYTVAARACGIKATLSRLLFSSVLRRLLRRPGSFLLP